MARWSSPSSSVSDCRSPPSRGPILARASRRATSVDLGASNLALLTTTLESALQARYDGLLRHRVRELRPGVHRHERDRRDFNGFQVYDLTDPTDPTLRSSFVCPGGQGDVSVYGNLLFMSVEETRGRIDCGTQGAPGGVNAGRFRGVRIFDISNIDNPVQLPGVQTCPRVAHPHPGPDPGRPGQRLHLQLRHGWRPFTLELAGCENAALTTSPVTTGNPTQWRIDVIKVPLANPAAAAIVSQPRIFTDPATGAFNGLQNTLPGTALHPSGTVYSPTPNTNTCHDITAYPAIGLAAGACQGNGILLDITDPVNPVRIDAVSDPNYSYWHSATLNNDGTTVIFTDEWGGGTSARCRITDLPEWGADAIFDIVDGQMQFASYYKLPAPQTTQENCVAHNSLTRPGPGTRHPRAGVVPGRHVDHRLHRFGEPDRNRVLRPGSDQHPEPDRAQPRRPVVDVLVQRHDLRLGDRPRLRHLRAVGERSPVRRTRSPPRQRCRLRSSTPSLRRRSSGRRASTSCVPTSTSRYRAGTLAGGRATAVATLIDRAEGLYDSGRTSAGEAVLERRDERHP